MDFVLNPEPVYSAVEVLSVSSEQPVDLDFTLPDYCPDVEKIFKCTVSPEVYSTSSGGGQLTIDGASVIRILYCSTDKKTLKCAEQTLPFSAVFNLSSDSGNLVTDVKAKTEYVNCKAVSPRRLMVHGAVSLNVKVQERKACNLYVPNENTRLQTDMRKTGVSELIALESEVFSVSESINIDNKPPVMSVLRSQITAGVNDVTSAGNRMLIKGEVTLCMLYSSEDNLAVPEQLTYVFPFVHNMECRGDSSALKDVELTVLSSDIKLKSDVASRNPLILLEVKLCANVASRKETEVSYISDAYSTDFDTELEYTSVALDAVVIPKTVNIMTKANLSLGDTDVMRIVDIFCDNVTVNPKLSDKLALSGKMNFCILALDSQSQLQYIERSVEIEHTENIDYEFNSTSPAQVLVKSLSYRLGDGNTLELRAETAIMVRLIKRESISAVSSVTDAGEFEPVDNCALTLYYGEKGESVWEICKRYRTDKGVFCAENNLKEAELSDKTLLLIPKA